MLGKFKDNKKKVCFLFLIIISLVNIHFSSGADCGDWEGDLMVTFSGIEYDTGNEDEGRPPTCYRCLIFSLDNVNNLPILLEKQTTSRWLGGAVIPTTYNPDGSGGSTYFSVGVSLYSDGDKCVLWLDASCSECCPFYRDENVFLGNGGYGSSTNQYTEEFPACAWGGFATITPVCIDDDGDGYGVGCILGEDCDDTNPNKWQWVSGLNPDNDRDGWPANIDNPQTVCVGDRVTHPTIVGLEHYEGSWWLSGSGFGYDEDDNDADNPGCCGHAECNGDIGTAQVYVPFLCSPFPEISVNCNTRCAGLPGISGGTCDSSTTGSYFCQEAHIGCVCDGFTGSSSCVNKQCIISNEIGAVECGANTDCAGKHRVCGNNICGLVLDISGQLNNDECIINSDCSSGIPSDDGEGFCGDGTINTPNIFGINEGCGEDEINTCVAGEKCIECQCVETGDLYWTNANGNFIFKAEIGDTVKMVLSDASAVGLSEGESAVFEIYEDDIGPNNDIRVGAEALEATVVDNQAVAVWTITQEDFGLGWGSAEGGELEFIFQVETEISGGLLVDEGSSGDDPIELEILNPVCGQDFSLEDSYNVNVRVSVSDADDIVTGTVSIDGWSENVTNGVHTFPYTFNDAGNIKITLRGENTKGHVKETTTNVMVIDENKYDVYVAACIDSPEDYEDIDESVVLFDATSSRALVYDNTKPEGEELTEVAGLNLGNWDKMTFQWLFSDGRINPHTSGDDSLSRLFYKTFIEAGDNWAELTVSVDV